MQLVSKAGKNLDVLVSRFDLEKLRDFLIEAIDKGTDVATDLALGLSVESSEVDKIVNLLGLALNIVSEYLGEDEA